MTSYVVSQRVNKIMTRADLVVDHLLDEAINSSRGKELAWKRHEFRAAVMVGGVDRMPLPVSARPLDR